MQRAAGVARCARRRDDTIHAPSFSFACVPFPVPWLLVAFALCAQAHAAGQVAKPAARPASAATSSYARRGDVRAYAAEVAAETGSPRRDVERWFAAARFQPKIVAAMDRPLLEPPKWFTYAPSFLAPERVEGGVKFWRDNAGTLERAQAEFGVPAEIIVAIIGIETYYGRFGGSYRVIDALATLAFDYPRRAAFFRGELKEFVLLARDQGFSPLVPKGSFAGAMGMPQFMPGSYRRFAVDFDGDGHVDLWRSNADVIGSIANYLVRHDWPRQPAARRRAGSRDGARRSRGD
jgi:membrane-bound lytic murein transglycosylase B